MRQSYFDLTAERDDLLPEQRSLYRLVSAALLYIPVMQVLTGISILVIYFLGSFGFLDTGSPLLIAVAIICMADGVLNFALYPLLRQGKITLVVIGIVIINGVLSSLMVLLWHKIAWFPIALSISAIALFLPFKTLRNSTRIIIVTIGAILVAFILVADSSITYPRIRLIQLSNMAALSLYATLTISMVLLGVLNSIINFRAIVGRLASVLTVATMISAVISLIIGSLATFYQNRSNTAEELEVISTLKLAQLKTALSTVKKRLDLPINDPVIAQRIRYLLSDNPDDLAYEINYDIVRTYLLTIENTPQTEILLLNKNGKAIMSTKNESEQRELSNNAFFQKAKSGLSFSIEQNFPEAREDISLLVLNAVFDKGSFAGVLVYRSNLQEIQTIIGNRAGNAETLETYLIAKPSDKIVPITQTRGAAPEVNSLPAQQTFGASQLGGNGIYTNYANKEVLGYFVWVPEIQTTLVTEIEQDEVLLSIRNIFFVNSVVAGLTITLIFVVVLVTSLTISRPITELAQKATALASGELSTRMAVNRQDEIGTLASSFNSMASELQSLVRTLEVKVEDRTQDLQKQANYLRIAAEIARDATNARNLDELLNNAAILILNRFGFYHTGIFLVDSQREFAILRASPTEAGREMLARSHRLRIGQVGIVGYVAATGNPRVVLDTTKDTTYFNNPLLPNTRSEAAIPLKIGTRVIGALDVQSENPEAFSQEDIATLQIMADQLAMAIQRAQLVEDLENNYRQLESAYQQFTVESWQKFGQEPDFKPGYKFDGVNITPIDSFPLDTRETLRKGRAIMLPAQADKEKGGTAVAAPIKLREQVIGVLVLRFISETVSADTISLIEEAANRLAVALENARLYVETQRLAQRERAVSEISSRITTSFNIENILRTTVAEIGRMMPEAEVVVQLEQKKEQ